MPPPKIQKLSRAEKTALHTAIRKFLQANPAAIDEGVLVAAWLDSRHQPVELQQVFSGRWPAVGVLSLTDARKGFVLASLVRRGVELQFPRVVLIAYIASNKWLEQWSAIKLFFDESLASVGISVLDVIIVTDPRSIFSEKGVVATKHPILVNHLLLKNV